MENLGNKSIRELLSLLAALMEELRTRGVLRSANNPTGDLGEHLFCAAFGWAQAPNSEKGFDATDDAGKRYQIKARRLHRRNKSRQLSAIRDYDGFDFLAAVLFDDDYRVLRAAQIPVAVVRMRATPDTHTASYRFMLTDDVWCEPGVVDVTELLRVAEAYSP